MTRYLSSCFAALLMATLLNTSVIAGPGHDHSHDEAPAASEGTASPRFEAHSDLFEAVGILEGNTLSLFIDRYADNAPVFDATAELESGEVKATGDFHEEHGDYSFDGASFANPGSYPITLTITAGDEIDILAANLVIPEEAHHSDEAHLERPVIWGIAALILLLALAWIASRLIKRRNAGGKK